MKEIVKSVLITLITSAIIGIIAYCFVQIDSVRAQIVEIKSTYETRMDHRQDLCDLKDDIKVIRRAVCKHTRCEE